jgi:hypothetical protein
MGTGLFGNVWELLKVAVSYTTKPPLPNLPESVPVPFAAILEFNHEQSLVQHSFWDPSLSVYPRLADFIQGESFLC